ncbi:MAG: ribosome-associated translation inhibitor RaiA [Elusimicrobiota bacterium]|jgi:putative sigma-54 modulation protein
MKINITARQMRLTPAIREYVEEKISKAEKYAHNILWAQVTLSVSKRAHQAEVILHASKQTFRALAEAADLYAAVDLASDKMDGQLKKYKEKNKSHHKEAPEAVLANMTWAVQDPVRISVIKQVSMDPMSADEAALQMERMGFNFWMFHEKESGQVSVLYRRLDDSYGLLTPTRSGR